MAIQIVMFFIIFALFQYFAKSRNLWGMGEPYETQKQVIVSALITSFIATAVYLALVYFFG